MPAPAPAITTTTAAALLTFLFSPSPSPLPSLSLPSIRPPPPLRALVTDPQGQLLSAGTAEVELRPGQMLAQLPPFQPGRLQPELGSYIGEGSQGAEVVGGVGGRTGLAHDGRGGVRGGVVRSGGAM